MSIGSSQKIQTEIRQLEIQRRRTSCVNTYSCTTFKTQLCMCELTSKQHWEHVSVNTGTPRGFKGSPHCNDKWSKSYSYAYMS